MPHRMRQTSLQQRHCVCETASGVRTTYAYVSLCTCLCNLGHPYAALLAQRLPCPCNRAKLHQAELVAAAVAQAQPPASHHSSGAATPASEKPAPAPRQPTVAQHQQEISLLLLQPGRASAAPAPPPQQKAPPPPPPKPTPPQPLITLDNVLSQELIAARVQEESALRRAELVERERDRVQRSLAEMQVGFGTMTP